MFASLTSNFFCSLRLGSDQPVICLLWTQLFTSGPCVLRWPSASDPGRIAMKFSAEIFLSLCIQLFAQWLLLAGSRLYCSLSRQRQTEPCEVVSERANCSYLRMLARSTQHYVWWTATAAAAAGFSRLGWRERHRSGCSDVECHRKFTLAPSPMFVTCL